MKKKTITCFTDYLKKMSNEELLFTFEQRIACDQYCPVTCNHQHEDFSHKDIENELLYRLTHYEH